MKSRLLAALVVASLGILAAACGGRDTSSGATNLKWFIAQQPGGALQKIADRCSRRSDGRYRISFELLPAQADAQREQLVRRLAAEDDTIDLIGMDVVWTGEFANAGWIRRVPAADEDELTRGVFDSVLDSARFENRLYAVPIWSNTQLLWYRKDRVKTVPRTWEQMIDQAERIGEKGTIQVQANRFEGLVVWANWMLESAGTSVLSSPQNIQLEPRATELALATMGRLGNSPAAASNIDTSTEDTARLGFEAGDSSFMINYPFVYPSAKENAPDVFKNMGAAKLPRVDPDLESKPPLGGINIGVSSYSKHGDLAFEASKCLVGADNQVTVAKLEGLPPVRSDLYDRKAIRDIYPGFAALLRSSIQGAAPRPSESPAYQDLSLAIQRGVHPVTAIDPKDPTPTYQRLRDKVAQAIKREGLL